MPSSVALFALTALTALRSLVIATGAAMASSTALCNDGTFGVAVTS